MTPLIKSLLIIVVASAVVVPTGVYAYSAVHSQDLNMAAYIPFNSTAVVRYDNNSSDYYAFSANNSAALIAPMTLNSLVKDYAANRTNQISGSLQKLNVTTNLSLYTTFNGFTIFQIKLNTTVNFSKVMAKFGQSKDYDKFMKNLSLNGSRTFNTSIFATQLTSGYIEVGGIGALESSISSHKAGTDFLAKSSSVFMGGANLSVYLNVNNNFFNNISLNAFSNHTYVNMTFNNSSSMSNVSALLGIVQKSDSSLIGSINQKDNYINFEILAGVSNLSNLSTLQDNFDNFQ